MIFFQVDSTAGCRRHLPSPLHDLHRHFSGRRQDDLAKGRSFHIGGPAEGSRCFDCALSFL